MEVSFQVALDYLRGEPETTKSIFPNPDRIVSPMFGDSADPVSVFKSLQKLLLLTVQIRELRNLFSSKETGATVVDVSKALNISRVAVHDRLNVVGLTAKQCRDSTLSELELVMRSATIGSQIREFKALLKSQNNRTEVNNTTIAFNDLRFGLP